MAPRGGGAGLKRRLTPDEEALWRRIQRSVTPLHGSIDPAPVNLVRLAPTAPPAVARDPCSTPPAQAPAAQPRTRSTSAAPADRGGERRVRRGKLDIAAKLDLHGFGQDRAREALHMFLRRERDDGARVVLVVTGRGMRPGPDGERKPGVLKQRFREWLGEPEFRTLVSGYASAHASHGGEGAYYVFLRRAERA